MITSALILSVLLPVQISQAEPKFSPFAVKAAVDTAVIIGLPPSKAVRKAALISQAPEFLMKEALQASEIVSIRRLFFRRYF
jgi:hypothetical protein